VIVEAVNAYRRQGKGVICIVADLPSSARQSFIGIDNRAAGKTAARLISEFAVQEALDRQEVCYRFTKELLERDSDLKAVYHFGAEMAGIVRAIQETDRTGKIVVVGHELTDDSRQLLARGAITAVLSQDATFMVERTLATFSDLLRGDLPAHRVYQLGPIAILFRENLPPPEA
jgi:LacI family transcriptional regulator